MAKDITPKTRRQKMALGDKPPEWHFRRHFPHAETKPYLRNAAVPRYFERSQHIGRWRPDWLAGAGGLEPPNGGIKIRCLTTWLRPISRLDAPLRARTIAAATLTINGGLCRATCR